MPLAAGTRAMGFILTADRARAAAFYRDVMGFACLSEDGFGSAWEMAGLEVRLTDLDGHQAGPHPVLGWRVPDLDAAVDALSAKGVRFAIYEGMGQDARGIWSAPDGATRLAWFTDPDGNVLSLAEGD